MPKEGLQLSFHQLTILIILLNVIKNYVTFRGMSRGCHLMLQCQKHAKISCGKIQITYMYKVTFLFFNDTYHWNLVNKIP